MSGFRNWEVGAEKSQDRLIEEVDAEAEEETVEMQEAKEEEKEKEKEKEKKCSVCGKELTSKVYDFSMRNFGKMLCMEHQHQQQMKKGAETGKDEFRIKELDGKGYSVFSTNSGKSYFVDPAEPYCSCPDFEINRRRREYCKHLKALGDARIVIAPISGSGSEREKIEIEVAAGESLQRDDREIQLIRGPLSVEMISELTKKVVDPRLICEAAKDGLGDGVLYDVRGNQEFIKEDFVAMIARMNNIVSECIELKYEEVNKYDGEPLLLARARARAVHIPTGTSVVRSASVIFDFKRMERESDGAEGRTFADRMAESDACRRAELALLGIPERILVPMVKKALERWRKEK